MERTSPSPLAQALAALFTTLIAALAEHAAEHPMLAPGIRASIRQIEQLAKKLDRMAAEWEAAQTTTQTPRAVSRPPPSCAKAIRLAARRRGPTAPFPRRCATMRNPSPPRAPPLPDSARPAPPHAQKLPRIPSGREPNPRTPVTTTPHRPRKAARCTSGCPRCPATAPCARYRPAPASPSGIAHPACASAPRWSATASSAARS